MLRLQRSYRVEYWNHNIPADQPCFDERGAASVSEVTLRTRNIRWQVGFRRYSWVFLLGNIVAVFQSSSTVEMVIMHATRLFSLLDLSNWNNYLGFLCFLKYFFSKETLVSMVPIVRVKILYMYFMTSDQSKQNIINDIFLQPMLHKNT